MAYREDVPLTDRDGNKTYPRTTAPSVHMGDTTLDKLLSNPNLLDNWYFGPGVINQRGQSSYTGVVYGIDMWQGAPAEGIVTTTANGLTLSVGTRISQKLEFPPAGERVTLTILVNDALVSETWLWNASAGYTVLTTANGWRLAYQPSNANMLQIYNVGGSADDLLKAAKLELGPVQTLAHKEDGKWVLNDPPPNPALELAKCQRYQIDMINVLLSGVANTDGSTCFLTLPLPTTMRVRPTVSEYKINYISGGGTRIDNPTITNLQVFGSNSSPYLQLSMDGLSAKQNYAAYLPRLFLDANL